MIIDMVAGEWSQEQANFDSAGPRKMAIRDRGAAHGVTTGD